MKLLSFLPLLTLAYAAQCPGYPQYQCCQGCTVRSEDGTGKWGIENGKWCSIKDSCNNNAAKECPGYPQYPCCQGCTVRSEDGSGKWGIENGKWCSIKDSCTSQSSQSFCKNPITTNVYAAHPAPLVVDDTLYVYTAHDESRLQNEFYTNKNYYVFSTKDMVNWTNHGAVLSLDNISYGIDRAWSPQAVQRNGKYYLYYTVEVQESNGNTGMGIGVAVANSPLGPFKEAIGKELVYQEDWTVTDPSVFIDDDGQAYLYFGNNKELRYVKLNKNMTSYNKTTGIVKVNISNTYEEAPFIYKRNGTYYMMFTGKRNGRTNAFIGYATASSPTGPWKYQGAVMNEDSNINNHVGVTDFKGKSYIFYETEQDNMFHRKVGVSELKFNSNGTINTVKKC